MAFCVTFFSVFWIFLRLINQLNGPSARAQQKPPFQCHTIWTSLYVIYAGQRLHILQRIRQADWTRSIIYCLYAIETLPISVHRKKTRFNKKRDVFECSYFVVHICYSISNGKIVLCVCVCVCGVQMCGNGNRSHLCIGIIDRNRCYFLSFVQLTDKMIRQIWNYIKLHSIRSHSRPPPKSATNK